MAVRSKRLWKANVTVTTVLLYTVPAGFTTIIKTITIANFGATALSWYLQVGTPTVGSSDYVYQAQALPPTTTTIINGLFIVMGPGDQAWGLLAGAGTARYRGYGAQLLGVSP